MVIFFYDLVISEMALFSYKHHDLLDIPYRWKPSPLLFIIRVAKIIKRYPDTGDSRQIVKRIKNPVFSSILRGSRQTIPFAHLD